MVIEIDSGGNENSQIVIIMRIALLSTLYYYLYLSLVNLKEAFHCFGGSQNSNQTDRLPKKEIVPR
jgi:hypothetical protein